MQRIYIYSKCPVKHEGFDFKKLNDNMYCHTIVIESKEKDLRKILDTTFIALIRKIVIKTLNQHRSYIPFEANVCGIFSEKLTEYLSLTGIKSRIQSIIITLLNGSNTLNLDGIIDFRLREFANDISAFFDMIFYEYEVQRKYDDFIQLVRNYVETEASKERLIHICFRDKDFRLYNSRRKDITDTAYRKYEDDTRFSGYNSNDFLISSLLYYVPERLIFHFKEGSENKNKKIQETINLIFEGRVSLCGNEEGGCRLCGRAEAVTISP